MALDREQIRVENKLKVWRVGQPVRTLEDGRKVKFIYQELPEDAAFLSAQLANNEIVYSVVLTKAGNPLSREDVESHFEGELSKQQ